MKEIMCEWLINAVCIVEMIEIIKRTHALCFASFYFEKDGKESEKEIKDS